MYGVKWQNFKVTKVEQRYYFDPAPPLGFGRIVNIGSVNGQAGQYGQVNYAAAKSGIHGFTKALAQEGARYNITVNAVAPGYVNTDMVRAVPEKGNAAALPGVRKIVVPEMNMGQYLLEIERLAPPEVEELRKEVDALSDDQVSQLLEAVEDVLFARREDATERLLEIAEQGCVSQSPSP